jgi:polyisoprenyl-teichoic acid--peptidoglycan teichoic acid transferase
MQRLIETSKWFILVGLTLLITVGVLGRIFNPVPTAAVVTPTPAPVDVPSATPVPPTATPTATPTPADTATPRPTSTRRPTATRWPTFTPSPTVTPTPPAIAIPGIATRPALADSALITSTLPQPPPLPYVRQPAGTVNILLLGMDRLAGEGVARTDVMVVASIFGDGPSVSLLSIPRDYYAWIPGWGLDKINTAYVRATRVGYPGGGPALTKATVEYNLGIPIHYYALVDFSSYPLIVDAVGGVDIVVECPFNDTFPDATSPIGHTDISLSPGTHHLNGKYALWYVRSRWNTSDFDRHRRQQQVLLAILYQARSQNMLVRLPELWDAYRQSVETDLGLKDVIYLASVAGRLDTRDINNYFIRGSHLITPWTAPNGGYVLVPNLDAMQSFVQLVMQPLAAHRAAQRVYSVTVVNGTGRPALGEVAAYRLRLEGFSVDAIETAAHQPRTQVVDYTTTAKGSPLYKLNTLYRLQAGDVMSEPTEGSAVDFRIVLGGNYDPCAGTNTITWQPAAGAVPTATPEAEAPGDEAPEGQVPDNEPPNVEAPEPEAPPVETP